MKLVVIYGPPGVGKLTVAQALQKVTGFKLLHNHLIADLCGTIFDFGTPTRARLNWLIRKTVFTVASENNISGVISTAMYYEGPQNKQAKLFARNCVKLMRGLRGEACFVRLFCDQNVLEERVANTARMNTKKITDVGKLRKVLETELPLAEIPADITRSLSINNTILTPEKVALKIKTFYKL